MDFVEYRNIIVANTTRLLESGHPLFSAVISKDMIYEYYLESFPQGSDPLHVTRSSHDCSTCSSFIKRLGRVVCIKPDYSLTTVWDVDITDPVYGTVSKEMHQFVLEGNINTLYLSRFNQIAEAESIQFLENALPGDLNTRTWHHFHATLPDRLVANDLGAAYSTFEGKVQVFGRALKELSLEAVEKITTEAEAGSFYKSPEYVARLKRFRELYKEYHELPEYLKDVFIHYHAAVAEASVVSIWSSVIGTFLQDFTSSKDWQASLTRYLHKVDAANFRRTTRPSSVMQRQTARQAFIDGGLMPSLKRKFMQLDEVPIPDVLYANSITHLLQDQDDPFAALPAITPSNSSSKVDPSRLKAVDWATFITEYLGSARKVELYLESHLQQNKVALVTAQDLSTPVLTSWGNHHTWAYSGNKSDRSITQNVATKGGKIDGCLRASMQWNDWGQNNDDLDLHCVIRPKNMPSRRIYHANRIDKLTLGNLDLDITRPRDTPEVENINFPKLDLLQEGTFEFHVKNYMNRGGKNGFRAEIVFGNEMYYYDCRDKIPTKGVVKLATVTYNKSGDFSIKHHLPVSTSPTASDFWGLEVNQFAEVASVMHSPNHWEGTPKTGNKHLFFMLQGMQSTEGLQPFFSEYLAPSLYNHRRVLDDLAGTMMLVDPPKDQLAGVGFSESIPHSVIVKITNADNTTNLIKVNG